MKKLWLAILCCLIFATPSLPACIDVSGTFTFTGGGPSWLTPPYLSDWPVYMEFNDGSSWVQVQAMNTNSAGYYFFTLPSAQVPYPQFGDYRVRSDNFGGTFLAGLYDRKPHRFNWSGPCTSYPNENFVFDFDNY